MRLFHSIILLFSLSLATIACGESTTSIDIMGTEKTPEDTAKVDIPQPALRHDSTFTLDFNGNPIEVIVKTSEKEFIGSIIVLPGWNYPNTGWCDSTDLCTEALSRGYTLILPQMGKSIYCQNTYPQTRQSWLKYPTRKWMSDEMMPYIQDHFALLLAAQPNFTLGLSTGARGATLLALDHPHIFNACAALSGDYDQSAFPKDNLYIGYYGQMNQFEERWTKDDNIITQIKQLQVPMYVGHGTLDKVVDIQHSDIFVEAMKQTGLNHLYHVDPNAAHTYSYWNSEVNAMLDFFEHHTD